MRISKHINILAILCLMTGTICARQFEQGEMIYINADQTFHDGCFNWSKDGAKIFLYIWKKTGATDSDAHWVSLSEETGALLGGKMPSGDFNRCIVVRKSSTGTSDNWNNIWNQTGDMTFPEVADRNYISKFWEGGIEADWLTYAPAADKIGNFAKSVTAEDIHICASALSGPYSLHVKLKADKSDYDYANVQCHGWYKSSDGSSWTSVDNYAGKARDGENDKDIINNNLPVSGPIYYYLHSAKKAGRRLLKITPDATGCDLDCTITSFEVACSEVNANDTTYTLDGMIAFGEPKGDLVITCDGQSTTIKATEAKSPQTFSITGLRAATSSGKTTTAVAKFTGSAGCTKSKTFTIPNATQGIVITHIDVPLGQTVSLNPSGANYENEHKWYIDGVEQPGMTGPQTSIAFDEPNTTRYMYREFNPPAGDMKDMMKNGGYEEADGNTYKTSPISEYDYWGKYDNASTPTDYYATHEGASNGFAVVQNANKFAVTYAGVTAREGSYFALFDAASGSTMAGKKAWYATTANNPNLKLQKGTTYLFSFWAANINNYGEMDNAAKLQFQIEYNGKTQKLGDPLDLNKADFRNNRWHQCSSTFYADADAASVTISVVNLNTNSLNIGNDFALDDIQFRAVSSVSRAVRLQQVFEVRSYNPCTDGRIFRKWDNVLFVNNGDSIYVAYQWYKNDQPMKGETLQRLYTGSTPMADTPDLYHCVATRKDGTEEKLCANTFNGFPESRVRAAVEDILSDGVAVWPTQVAAGGNVTVSKTFAGTMQATVLTLTGQMISTCEIRGEHTMIAMPQTSGLYLLRLQSGQNQQIVKINVN